MSEAKREPAAKRGSLGGVAMDGILGSSRDLGRRISESDIYLNYRSALEWVKEHPECLVGIAELKRVQIEYSRGEMNMDKEKHISKLYFDLCANPDVARFLEAEKKMLALMLEIHENLWADCDIYVAGEGMPT